MEEEMEEEMEETEEELLARLGIQMDAELKAMEEELNPEVVEQWLGTERRREQAQWLPLRDDTSDARLPGDTGSGEDDQEVQGRHTKMERIASIEDLQDCLFSIPGDLIRVEFLLRCLTMLHAPTPVPYISSNSSFYKLYTTFHIPQYSQNLAQTADHLKLSQSEATDPPPLPWMSISSACEFTNWGLGAGGRREFVHNLFQLGMQYFPSDSSLRDALLGFNMHQPPTGAPSHPTLELSSSHLPLPPTINLSIQTPAPIPPCAIPNTKAMLAAYSYDLSAWAGYARADAVTRGMKQARKTFNTALSAAHTIPAEHAHQVALLFEAYAEAEVQEDIEDKASRGLHILCSFSEHSASSPFTPLVQGTKKKKKDTQAMEDGAGLVSSGISEERQVAARRKYQSLLDTTLSSASTTSGTAYESMPCVSSDAADDTTSPHTSGGLDMNRVGVAVVGCAAMTSFLTLGFNAAAAIYEQVLALMGTDFTRAGQYINSSKTTGIRGALAGAALAPTHELLICKYVTLAELATWYALGWSNQTSSSRSIPGSNSFRPKCCCSPSNFRRIISRALHFLPNNPHLLSKLSMTNTLGTHARSHLQRQLDIMLNPALHHITCSTVWLEALRSSVFASSSLECREGQNVRLQSKKSYRIHSLMERATSYPGMQHCVLIWRMYMAYEAACGNFDNCRRVFFRAIHACPWSKSVWCDGLQHLSRHLPGRQLKDLMDMMQTKDILIRTDLYEIMLEQMEQT